MINALKLKATIGIDFLIANPNEIFVYVANIYNFRYCLNLKKYNIIKT